MIARLFEPIVRPLSVVAASLRVPQHGAVRELNLVQTADRLTCFRLKEPDRNGVPDLDRISAPTDNANRRGTARLHSPLPHFASIVFKVEVNQHVGIQPTVFRHNRVFQHYRLAHVIRGSPVMGKQGSADRQKARNYKNEL